MVETAKVETPTPETPVAETQKKEIDLKNLDKESLKTLYEERNMLRKKLEASKEDKETQNKLSNLQREVNNYIISSLNRENGSKGLQIRASDMLGQISALTKTGNKAKWDMEAAKKVQAGSVAYIMTQHDFNVAVDNGKEGAMDKRLVVVEYNGQKIVVGEISDGFTTANIEKTADTGSVPSAGNTPEVPTTTTQSQDTPAENTPTPQEETDPKILSALADMKSERQEDTTPGETEAKDIPAIDTPVVEAENTPQIRQESEYNARFGEMFEITDKSLLQQQIDRGLYVMNQIDLKTPEAIEGRRIINLVIKLTKELIPIHNAVAQATRNEPNVEKRTIIRQAYEDAVREIKETGKLGLEDGGDGEEILGAIGRRGEKAFITDTINRFIEMERILNEKGLGLNILNNPNYITDMSKRFEA